MPRISFTIDIACDPRVVKTAEGHGVLRRYLRFDSIEGHEADVQRIEESIPYTVGLPLPETGKKRITVLFPPVPPPPGYPQILLTYERHDD